jgi:hypothetical protein
MTLEVAPRCIEMSDEDKRTRRSTVTRFILGALAGGSPGLLAAVVGVPGTLPPYDYQILTAFGALLGGILALLMGWLKR